MKTERQTPADRSQVSGPSADGEAVVGPEFYDSVPGTSFRARCPQCKQIVWYRNSDDIDRHVARHGP